MSESDEFFRGGHWGQCLELLSHLSQYSDSILLVSGPMGIGKSTLKRALMQVEEHNLSFCEIQATADLNADGLMARLDEDIDRPQGKDVVLVIEDAQHLSINAMAVLLQLKQRSGIKQRLHMVLFATPDFAQKLNDSVLREEFAEMVHVIELEPLTLPELETFLEYKLNIRQDKQWYKRIFALSGGIPGSAEQLAKDSLSGKKDLLSTKKAISPTMVGFVVSFGLVFCLLAILWPDADDSLVAQPQHLASLDDTKPELQPEPEPAPEPLPIPEPVAEPEPAPQLQVNQELTLAQEKISELELKIAQLQQQLSQVQQAKQTPVPSPKALPKAKTKKLVKAAPIKTAKALKLNYNENEKYILGIAGKNYTLQLLGSSSEAKMQEFIKANNLGKYAHYFKSSYKGKPWYVLIYGNYASREAANSAISKLPLDVKKLRPWPREFARIQQSIKNER